MKSFVRATKLPSIGGRAAYMTNPSKQEEIVLESEPVDWKPYSDFEATQHKTNARQNEGREVMVALPNDWYGLQRDELRNRIDAIARATVGEGWDFQWAVHWNKARTNLHVHIIFSERLRVNEPKRWDRDVYLRDDGKVARTKSERAREPDGSFKPPIHKKGDLKADPFTAKDTRFKSKAWLHEKKQELQQLMAEEWGVKFEKQPYLPEFHEGKGSESEIIAKKNVVIRENNHRLGFLESQGVDVSQYVGKIKAIQKNKGIPLLVESVGGGFHVFNSHEPDLAILAIQRTRDSFMEVPDRAEPEAEKEIQEESEAVASTLPLPDPEPEKPKILLPTAPEQRDIPNKKGHEEPTAPPERKGFLERIRATISFLIVQRAERAAQRAAAERARKAAEEQSQRAAAEQLAAQRAAYQAAQQLKTETIAALKHTVENRWDIAQRHLRGWRTSDGEKALADMRKDGSAFPVIYRDSHYGWSIKVFRADQWQQAKDFADRTGADFDGYQSRMNPMSMEQYKADIEKLRPQIGNRPGDQRGRESRNEHEK